MSQTLTGWVDVPIPHLAMTLIFPHSASTSMQPSETGRRTIASPVEAKASAGKAGKSVLGCLRHLCRRSWGQKHAESEELRPACPEKAETLSEEKKPRLPVSHAQHGLQR